MVKIIICSALVLFFIAAVLHEVIATIKLNKYRKQRKAEIGEDAFAREIFNEIKTF